MTPVFAARRRAEEFAALVEDASTHRAVDARYADLFDLVTEMRQAPAPEARPEFVADLRERLLAEAATALAPADAGTRERASIDRLTLPARRPARERRIAAAVGGLALVGATTSMAMAAQSALPGDALYPVKRAIESVHTGLSVGEGDKGSTMLANASGRLDEVTQLSNGDNAQNGIVIADTLNDFTDQSAQASDLLLADYSDTGNQQSVNELRDFTARSLDQLTALVVLAGVVALTPGVTFARVRALVGLGEQRLHPVVAVRLHGPHRFETTQPGSSDPVSYDPCRPIHYVVNPEGAPADHREMVQEAVAEVSRATGFEFAYDGTTRDRDFVHRGDGFSVHEAPVLIGWATPQEVPALAGEVAGLGGSAYVERTPDHRTYVTGSVTLDRDEFIGFDALPGGYDALRAIVMHELAHVVGLGHVQDPAELMYDGHLQRTTFGPGDLEGLASLGAVDCL